tara:strand:- start:274 stop:579 length:306 start_codon:yes stop_codon:yes gene_type:complete
MKKKIHDLTKRKTYRSQFHCMLEHATYRYAKTMPKFPHYYTMKDTWKDTLAFEEVVKHIRKFGIKQKFWNTSYIYLYLDKYKYWTMGAPVSETILINREKL